MTEHEETGMCLRKGGICILEQPCEWRLSLTPTERIERETIRRMYGSEAYHEL